MNWTNPVMIICAFPGLVYLLVGVLLWRKPPKKISHSYGYRTPGSMLSQERWDFAQPYAGRQFAIAGIVLMLCSLMSLFGDMDMRDFWKIMVLFMLITFLPIVLTEMTLNRHFPKNKNKQP